MGNTLSFVDVLKDTHAENQREKLSALEMKCGARKLLLSNPMMDVVYMTENELLLVKGDLLPSDKPTESWPTRNPIMMTHLCMRYGGHRLFIPVSFRILLFLSGCSSSVCISS